jgi:hypothetical protein
MNRLKYIIVALLVLSVSSCTKNEIEYMTTSIGSDAQFQLHYFVPVVSNSANNITKVEVNGELYANPMAPLTTYNAIPSGGVGLFYRTDPGEVNIKLYQGTNGDVLVYDTIVNLTPGKQNIFVHSFTELPVIYDNGYPYSKNVTMNTDSTAYVKFYNFLYETAGVPNTLRLQYQYIDSRTLQAVNIGQPVSFGETTGWQPVKVLKSVFNSAGSRLLDFKIKTVDIDGNIVGDLSVRNAGGAYVPYTGTATLAIGRRYHMTMAGFRAASPVSSVRTFTAQ